MRIKNSIFFTVFILIFIFYPVISIYAQEDIDSWRRKTVLVFAPHPDDETWCTGTMGKLIDNGNTVYIVIFTTGNKGTRDTTVSAEEIARIRKVEDEASNAVIGLLPENIIWLGYDDGELEYVPEKELCEKVCWLIRKYRPDAVFSYDPDTKWAQWHKSDHRMAAYVTLDGTRAASYYLYFPHHRSHEGLQPFTVTDYFFFQTYEPNYWVDISDYVDKKIESMCKHVSQYLEGEFGKSSDKYSPVMSPKTIRLVENRVKNQMKDGKNVEIFRRVTESMSF